mmetsp:Transcript_39611/g.67471  ORF Transcript_39611/g.67471 Transcript_39611/m.67471 type:complete len:169 (+) Transcript_39611:389-895(+)
MTNNAMVLFGACIIWRLEDVMNDESRRSFYFSCAMLLEGETDAVIFGSHFCITIATNPIEENRFCHPNEKGGAFIFMFVSVILLLALGVSLSFSCCHCHARQRIDKCRKIPSPSRSHSFEVDGINDHCKMAHADVAVPSWKYWQGSAILSAAFRMELGRYYHRGHGVI